MTERPADRIVMGPDPAALLEAMADYIRLVLAHPAGREAGEKITREGMRVGLIVKPGELILLAFEDADSGFGVLPRALADSQRGLS